VSWWNKKENADEVLRLKPTLGLKKLKEYKKKLKIKRRGK
jgi:hypothetical protein|tara:strand:+ start:1671 stop:1790 length:120 start_codon:yes stop_codon:yes gene_type:complete